MEAYDHLSKCPGLWEVVAESLSGFVDGRLPGDLGDTPGFLDSSDRGEAEDNSSLDQNLYTLKHRVQGAYFAVEKRALRRCSGPSLQPAVCVSHHASGCPLTPGGSAFSGIQRASCLMLYKDFLNHYISIKDSRLCLPWQALCQAVPLIMVRKLIDGWKFCSGAAAHILTYSTTAVGFPDPLLESGRTLPRTGQSWRARMDHSQGMPSSARLLASTPLTPWSWRPS